VQKAKVIQQITIVPGAVDKLTGATVHVSLSSVVVDDDGKLFAATGEGPADLHLADADIVEKSRELRDLVAQRLADSQKSAVMATGDSKAALTQPKAEI
jgi:glucose/arabinose dehydrogenase